MEREVTMTKQEYDERLATLKKQFEQAKNDLAIEFAKSNNPYKVGDILSCESRKVIIRVEKITYRYSYDGTPYCVYNGPALKKDLTPRKVSPLSDSIGQDDKIIKLN